MEQTQEQEMIPQTQPTEEKKKRPYVSRAKNPQRKVTPDKYVKRKTKSFPEEELIRTNGKPYKPVNPYGSNQFIKDPRQAAMWEIFLDDWMKGGGNAKQAALAVGYSETTAANVTNLWWFKEKFAKLKRKDMLSRSERNLGRMLDIEFILQDEDGKEIVDIDRAKLVADISKLVATTLGKDEGYSTKSEVSKNVSGTVNIKAVNYADQAIEEPKPANVIDITGEEDE